MTIMKRFSSLFARTPYRYRGNPQVIGLGVGVQERAFLGTSPGAPHGFQTQLQGTGGVLVRRSIHPTFGPNPVTPFRTQTTPIGGLTGGLYQTAQLTLTALSQYVPQQPYNGNGPAPI